MDVSIKEFERRTGLNRGIAMLIAINLAVYLFLFLLFNIIGQRFGGSTLGSDVNILSLPASLRAAIISPWSIITYMFTQLSLSHLFFNMIFLWLVGRVLSRFLTSRRSVILYLVSGISGAAFFLLFYLSVPAYLALNVYLEGASACVYGLLVFITLYKPSLSLRFILREGIPIRWITGFLLILNLLGLGGDNYAANFAHLGGAFGGTIYYLYLKIARKSLTPPIENDAELAQIMDKVKKSGYSSLTKRERDLLINRSK